MSLDFSLYIDDQLYYFSFENWLPRDSELGTKKGIRLYHPGTSDTAHLRTSNGLILTGAPDTRVELPYLWQTGHTYSLRLARADSGIYDGDEVGDWFNLTISDNGGEPLEVGGILIPRKEADEPVELPSRVMSWFKLVNYQWGESPGPS